MSSEQQKWVLSGQRGGEKGTSSAVVNSLRHPRSIVEPRFVVLSSLVASSMVALIPQWRSKGVLIVEEGATLSRGGHDEWRFYFMTSYFNGLMQERFDRQEKIAEDWYMEGYDDAIDGLYLQYQEDVYISGYLAALGEMLVHFRFSD